MGDALLDLIYAAALIAAGITLGGLAIVSVAESADDSGGYGLLAIAALVIIAGVCFVVRAIVGRSGR